MRPRWVKKRDGTPVLFDPRRLLASLVAAAEESGEALLADEICEVVALLIERRFAHKVPLTSELRDLVERVLLETNHARTAEAYARHHTEHERARAGLRVEAREPLLGPTGELPASPPSEAWSDSRVAKALVRACGLSPDVAESVSEEVERRVLALGLKRVRARLVRELVDAVLEERGFGARLPVPTEIALDVEEIERSLKQSTVRQGHEPLGHAVDLEHTLGVNMLARHALAAGLPPEAAHAHRRGRMHVLDLGRPMRLTSGAIALDHLKVALGARAPTCAAELAMALAGLIARAAPYHARALGVPFANVFLAPFARGREAAVRRDLREAYRILAACAPSVAMRLHVGPVPAELVSAGPIGQRGKRWRAGYGDLSPESERVARLLAEVALEERDLAGPHRPQLVASFGAFAPLPPDDAVDAYVLDAPGFAPPVAFGLASGAQLTLEPGPTPLVAGCARMIGLGCAPAAYEAGPGDVPAFRSSLEQSLVVALDAFVAMQRSLGQAILRPHADELKLWRPLGPAEVAPVVEAPRATWVIGLIGLAEAMEHLLGERASRNPAVRQAANEVVAELDARARAEGSLRGLTVRLEEHGVHEGAQRLADLDVATYGEPARRTLRPNGTVPHYGVTLTEPPRDAEGARAALAEVYRPLGLAPIVVRGPAALQEVERWREGLALLAAAPTAS